MTGKSSVLKFQMRVSIPRPFSCGVVPGTAAGFSGSGSRTPGVVVLAILAVLAILVVLAILAVLAILVALVVKVMTLRVRFVLRFRLRLFGPGRP